MGSVECLGTEPVVSQAVIDEQERQAEAARQQQAQQEAALQSVLNRAASTARAVAEEAAKTRNAALIGTIQAIASILAVRLILLLSVIGAFSLAVMAMKTQDNTGLFVLIAYAFLTVIPLTFLDAKSRLQGNG